MNNNKDFSEYFKFIILKTDDISKFCTSSHDICYEMNRIFYPNERRIADITDDNDFCITDYKILSPEEIEKYLNVEYSEQNLEKINNLLFSFCKEHNAINGASLLVCAFDNIKEHKKHYFIDYYLVHNLESVNKKERPKEKIKFEDFRSQKIVYGFIPIVDIPYGMFNTILELATVNLLCFISKDKMF